MKYDHIVNHNGIYYRAGQDVPENEEREANTELPFSDISAEIIKPSPKRGRPIQKQIKEIAYGRTA